MTQCLTKLRKKRFREQIPSLAEYFERLKEKWESDYGWLKINVKDNEVNDNFGLTADILDVIFDNLILNSVQQNENKSQLNIEIEYHLNLDDEMLVYYSDDGKGLSEKYSEDCYSILKVHETTRDNGHGLGMWLLNKSIDSQKGKITNIFSESGFHIHFTLQRG